MEDGRRRELLAAENYVNLDFLLHKGNEATNEITDQLS
jgi:hypothetical protein